MPPRGEELSSAGGRPPLRVFYPKGAPAAHFEEVVAAHERNIARGENELKKGVVTRVPYGDAQAAVKHYATEGWSGRAKEFCRISRLWRAWRGIQRLREAGMPVPELLAVLRCGGKGYLVTRYLEGTTPLHEWLSKPVGGDPAVANPQDRDALVGEFGAWLRSLHDKGIYHDDWSAKNFRVGVEAGHRVFYIVDFESVSAWKWWWRRRRRRAKNLAQVLGPLPMVEGPVRDRLLAAYAAGKAAFLTGRFRRRVEKLLGARVKRSLEQRKRQAAKR